MKKIKLFWIFPFFGIIFLISLYSSPTKTEKINIDLNCGHPVEFTYKGETVIYGSVSGQNSTCWLDRNLGAYQVCTSSTDEDCYGDLFQWGRGDDGHQDRNSGTTSNLSSTDDPGHSDFIIHPPPFSFDWRSTQNDNLWQGVDGVNNPCPDGWRVPTEAELRNEISGWSLDSNSGAFASPLKWPAAGNPGHNGYFYPVVSNFSLSGSGKIWSSSISSTASNYIRFGLNYALRTSSSRANGYSVRCILD